MKQGTKLRIAIFASGSGSNMQAIVDSREAGELPVDIVAIICNKPEAGVIARAQRHQLPLHLIPSKGLDREEHERRIMSVLDSMQPELLVFAGYMRLVSNAFISHYYNQRKQLPGIMNIHPALLPSFPGVDGYGDAFRYGVKVSGITVHFIDAGMDTGPIIVQEALCRRSGESLEDFRARGLAIEHALYPRAIQWYAEDRISVHGRWVEIRE